MITSLNWVSSKLLFSLFILSESLPVSRIFISQDENRNPLELVASWSNSVFVHLIFLCWILVIRKRINRKQNARCQYLSWLKASAFFFEIFLLGVKKHNNVFLRLVSPSSWWLSPVKWLLTISIISLAKVGLNASKAKLTSGHLKPHSQPDHTFLWKVCLWIVTIDIWGRIHNTLFFS